jgi:hypothetical protein
VTRIRRSTLPLLAALLLLGQGPLCQLTCAPSTMTAHAASPAADPAMPPCHGPQSSPEPAPTAPEHSEHECTVCDQVASSGSFAPKPAATPAGLHPGAAALARIAIRATESAGLRPPDHRAPPRPDVLLQKSSLLL